MVVAGGGCDCDRFVNIDEKYFSKFLHGFVKVATWIC